MKQRLIMWLAVVAGVALLLAAAWAAILWTRPEPIRIAFASSLSGPSASAGEESLVATQLAIDEVNAKADEADCDYRTAAYSIAIGRVADACQLKGLCP